MFCYIQHAMIIFGYYFQRVVLSRREFLPLIALFRALALTRIMYSKWSVFPEFRHILEQSWSSKSRQRGEVTPE